MSNYFNDWWPKKCSVETSLSCSTAVEDLSIDAFEHRAARSHCRRMVYIQTKNLRGKRTNCADRPLEKSRGSASGQGRGRHC